MIWRSDLVVTWRRFEQIQSVFVRSRNRPVGHIMAMNEYQTAPASPRRVVTDAAMPKKQDVQTVSLNVAGINLTIRTTQDLEYLNGLVSQVNSLVQSLKQSAPNSAIPQLMAMALIQFADRASEAQMALERSNRKVETHIERLTKILGALDNPEF